LEVPFFPGKNMRDEAASHLLLEEMTEETLMFPAKEKRNKIMS